MLKDFKEFALRGNVMDMAVGIIIGAAFGKIVSSFVEDVLMPPIGQLLGGLDFSALFITLGSGSYETLAAAKEAGAATLNYGIFINTVIDFLIVAFSIFMLIKVVNKMRRQIEPEPVPAPVTEETDKACPFCYSTIAIKATRCPQCTSMIE